MRPRSVALLYCSEGSSASPKPEITAGMMVTQLDVTAPVEIETIVPMSTLVYRLDSEW